MYAMDDSYNIFEENILYCCNESFNTVKLSRARSKDKRWFTASLRKCSNKKLLKKITFIMLYKAMVRPYVEYANSIWSPYKKGDIEAIEKVQKRATKLVISHNFIHLLKRQHNYTQKMKVNT